MKMKKYTKNKQLGNKGVAYLENLLSDYAIVHKIDEAKDIGCDLLCEWVNQETPSGLLFLIQVKTSRRKLEIETITERHRLNLLEQVKIKNAPSIDKRTMEYWGKPGIPAYLFVLFEKPTGIFDVYYKRFTPIVTKESLEDKGNFYKVSKDGKFLAFGEVIIGKTKGGFVRDLFIDYMRCTYKKGSLAYKNPRELGLDQFPEKDVIFKDLAEEYKPELGEAINKMKDLKLF